MSLTLMMAAGAAVLLLVAALFLQRRRTAAAADEDADEAPADSSRAWELGLDDNDWREAGTADRLKAVLRGGRHGIALWRDAPEAIFLERDGDGVCIVERHDSVYGGRPNWEHISDLTLTMGKAERCWPDADLSGLLRYADTAVPVEYSPRLLADLEDDEAPDPSALSTG